MKIKHSLAVNIYKKESFLTILHFLKRLFISTYLSLHDETNGEGNIRRFGCCCSNMFLYSSSCHFCCYYYCCYCLPSSWYFCFCCVCRITREGTYDDYFFLQEIFQLATFCFLRLSDDQTFDFILMKVLWCDRCPIYTAVYVYVSRRKP